MFAAPPVIETRLIARLPESLHIHGRTSGRYENRKYYLEGPAFASDGTFFFTDVPWGRIFRLTPEGDLSLFHEYDGEPNGMKFHKDGRLFIADYKNGILAMDLETKKLEVYVDRVCNERLRGPNDLFFASNGDLYFTDQGNSDSTRPHGRVVRVRAADRQSELILENLPSPNGLCLSPDENFLYVAMTRSNAIWKAPLVVPPGLIPTSSVGTTGVFIQLSGGTGPDGLAVDSKANLLIAHTGLGVLWVFSPVGEPLFRVNTCAGLSIANIAFDVRDMRTIYIIESATGSVLAADLPVPGNTLFGQMR